jgi:preprotein translocase subunit SecE
MASVTKNDGKNAMADEAELTGPADEGPGDNRAGEPPAKGPIEYASGRTPSGRPGEGFFTIHKKGQGYWTRIGTVAGASLLAILTAQFLYTNLKVYASVKTALIGTGVFLAVFALLVFRLINRPKVVDFLIATDSEMKKVNWTTRAELIGSTKVVIIFMLLIGVLLFAFDTFFGYFFYLIRVLQVGPFG